METWLSLIAGLVLLVLGGEFLVRGAVRVASRLGVSPLVIGLTLVGFGTSTPELVTSVQAALTGSPGIAYGNIVGSNIANILLILGASAVITPIAVASGALKRDGAVMVAVAAVFIVLGLAMTLGRFVGLAFVAALAAYVFLAFRQESRGTEGRFGTLAADESFRLLHSAVWSPSSSRHGESARVEKGVVVPNSGNVPRQRRPNPAVPPGR